MENRRWYRVVWPDARWDESSDREELEEFMKARPGEGTLYRLYERTEREWRPCDSSSS